MLNQEHASLSTTKVNPWQCLVSFRFMVTPGGRSSDAQWTLDVAGGGGGEGRGGGAGGVEGKGWNEQCGKPTFIRSLDLFNCTTLSLEWYWRGPRSQEVGGG